MNANGFVKGAAAVFGAAVSFATGIPAVMWVLLGAMTLDYVTGLLCAAAGVSDKTKEGRLSSRAAFNGLIRKCMVLLVVLLAVLLDAAVQTEAGVSFHAVTGATCRWFVAAEGVSILENAAGLGLPIPGVLLRALEMMRSSGEGETRRAE